MGVAPSSLRSLVHTALDGPQINQSNGEIQSTLEGHSNRKNAQTDKKMAGRERGGEECPGIMRQSFVFARPITFGFAYMNPTLIG